jgi:hypothetical protein
MIMSMITQMEIHKNVEEAAEAEVVIMITTPVMFKSKTTSLTTMMQAVAVAIAIVVKVM